MLALAKSQERIKKDKWEIEAYMMDEKFKQDNLAFLFGAGNRA